MTTLDRPGLPQNHLLAALDETEKVALCGHLEPVWLSVGDVLYQPGKKLSYGYFPTSAIVSLHHINEAGATDETASAGSDGFIGVSLFLGSPNMPFTAVVQNAGQAWRVAGPTLVTAFHRGGNLSWVLLRYTQALIAQMTLTMSCNCHHSVEQRLSFWLLNKLDRGVPAEMLITQETIAGALGVRREAVTLALGSLQRAGFIKNGRGHLSIVDRSGLASVACGCYAEMQRERNNLLRDLQTQRLYGRITARHSQPSADTTRANYATGHSISVPPPENATDELFKIAR